MSHRVLNLTEVASYLHLQEADVSLLVKRREIPHNQAGGQLKFRKAEIDRWASRRLLDMNAKDLHAFHKESTAKAHDLSAGHALVPELMRPELIRADLDVRTRAKLIRSIVDVAVSSHMVWDEDGLLEGVQSREEERSTALPCGVALLHPSQHEPYMFEDSFVVLARSASPLPFGCEDGGLTQLFFLVCSQEDRIHLHLLARLSMMCRNTDLVEELLEAYGEQEMFEALLRAEEEVMELLKKRVKRK